MKHLIFVITFLGILSANELVRTVKKRPLSEVLPIVERLKSDAFVLGKGQVNVYAFIDPQCPRSREFIDFIAESKRMRSRYRYHFFLLELKRFHSASVIEALYRSNDPRQHTIDYMRGKVELSELPRIDQSVQSKIARIEDAAKAIGVYKRPYLILDKSSHKARRH